MRRLILSFIILGFTVNAYSISVTIKGEVQNPKGSEVSAFRYADLISEKLIYLGSGAIDEANQFMFRIDVKYTQKIILRVGWSNALMVVQPGKEYDINIPESGVGEVKSFQGNSYLKLSFKNLEEGDPNALISELNKDFDNFFAENYIEIAKSEIPNGSNYKRAREEDLKKLNLIEGGAQDSTSESTEEPNFLALTKEFSKELREKYGKWDNEYFQTYLTFTLADLEYSAGASKKEIFENYISSEPVHYQHPEYIRFLRNYYFNLFNDIASVGEGKVLNETLNKISTYEELANGMNYYDYVNRDSLREVAALIGLQEAWFLEEFSTGSCQGILTSMAQDKDQIFREEAINMLFELNIGKKNFKPENLKMLNSKDEWVSFDDYKGEFVYMAFISSWCRNCEAELGLLQELKRKYGKQIEFLVVSLDEEYSVYKEFMHSHPQYDWELLYGPSDRLLREKLNLKSVPLFYLFDPNGRLMESYTKSPSEGIEKIFYKIQNQKAKPPGVLKVWDD